MKRNNPTADIYPTVYSLCAIHAARNAEIFTANHRSLVVQWAKTGNDEDNTYSKTKADARIHYDRKSNKPYAWGK